MVFSCNAPVVSSLTVDVMSVSEVIPAPEAVVSCEPVEMWEPVAAVMRSSAVEPATVDVVDGPVVGTAEVVVDRVTTSLSVTASVADSVVGESVDHGKLVLMMPSVVCTDEMMLDNVVLASVT